MTYKNSIKMRMSMAVACLLSIGISASYAQQPFHLKGELTRADADSGTILVSYYDGGKLKFDTAGVRGGLFELKGKVGEERRSQIFWLKPKPKGSETKNESEAQLFYMAPGVNTVEGTSIFDARISGGQAQALYNTLNDRLKEKGVPVREGAKLDAAQKAQKARVELDFMREHPNSVVSFDLMKSIATAYNLAQGTQEIETVFRSFPESWKSSKDGKKIQERIASAKVLGVGKQAIEFTSKDSLGNPVSLSDFRGQYVLLDFWASWCAPCRAENPNLIKAYEKYKDRNFTILGVSLDAADARQAWIDAVQEDNMTWTQVADLTGWDSDLAKQYHIQSIPMNYLIDPDGKIIAVSLRGEQLHIELEKHL